VRRGTTTSYRLGIADSAVLGTVSLVQKPDVVTPHRAQTRVGNRRRLKLDVVFDVVRVCNRNKLLRRWQRKAASLLPPSE